LLLQLRAALLGIASQSPGVALGLGRLRTLALQRRLRVGYTRAGRLIDMLERRGIISGYEGSKPRQVLIGEADVPRILSHLEEADSGARRVPRVADAVTVPDEPAEP